MQCPVLNEKDVKVVAEIDNNNTGLELGRNQRSVDENPPLLSEFTELRNHKGLPS